MDAIESKLVEEMMKLISVTCTKSQVQDAEDVTHISIVVTLNVRSSQLKIYRNLDVYSSELKKSSIKQKIIRETAESIINEFIEDATGQSNKKLCLSI